MSAELAKTLDQLKVHFKSGEVFYMVDTQMAAAITPHEPTLAKMPRFDFTANLAVQNPGMVYLCKAEFDGAERVAIMSVVPEGIHITDAVAETSELRKIFAAGVNALPGDKHHEKIALGKGNLYIAYTGHECPVAAERIMAPALA